MTRAEFNENVNDFYDLMQACNDVGSSYMEDCIESCYYDDWILDDIRDALSDWSWQEIYRALYNLSDSSDYDFFRRSGCLDYEGLSDYEFDEWKADVYDELDSWDYFDDDEEEEDDDEYEEVEEEPLMEFDTLVINTMVVECTNNFFLSVENDEKKTQEEDAGFARLLRADEATNIL